MLKEAEHLLPLIKGLPKTSQQLNQPFCSDSELLRLSSRHLAITIDSIASEIQSGLYGDWPLIGWMSGVVSLSDLVATAANPQGLLVSTQWESKVTDKNKKDFYRGLGSFLRSVEVPLVGGDSGSSQATDVTSVGIGCYGKRPLTRMGAKVGDIILTTAKVGQGAAYALDWLLYQNSYGLKYKPMPFMGHSDVLMEVASSCIDTSDGIISSLCTIMDLNNVSVELWAHKGLFKRSAKKWCQDNEVPTNALLFTEHGDYQLILTVPEKIWLNMVKEQKKLFIPIGRIRGKEEDFKIHTQLETSSFDPMYIMNRNNSTSRELKKNFKSLVKELKKKNLGCIY